MYSDFMVFDFLINILSSILIAFLAIRSSGYRRELKTLRVGLTNRQEVDSRSSYASMYDALTGLPNKELLFGKIEHLIAMGHANRGINFDVIYLDIEGFGKLNTKLGESGADSQLALFGELVRKNLSELKDIFAYRLGGDEFVFISSLDTESLCETILGMQDVVGMKFHLGICTYHSGNMNSYEILQNAETAMLASKAPGSDRVIRYDPKLESDDAKSTSIKDSLLTAFDYDEFNIVLQPIVDLQTGRVVGAEILVRWNHRKLGFIPPSEFIPLARNLGILPKLDTYVLLRSLQLLKKFTQQDWFRGLKLTINLSVEQLESPTLLRTLLEYTRKFHVEAKCLALEIPAGYLTKTEDEVKPMLSSLSDMGFTFIMNEFGSSYGSLIRLRKFAINSVKIEPSFMANILRDESGKSMLGALVNMAKSMNVNVLAGGIESADQIQTVLDSGVQMGQGYFICKPLRPTQFQEFVELSDSKSITNLRDLFARFRNRKTNSNI